MVTFATILPDTTAVIFEGEFIASGVDWEGATKCFLYRSEGGKYIMAERRHGPEGIDRYAATVASSTDEVYQFLTRDQRFSGAAKDLLRRATIHDPAFEEYLFEEVE